MTDNFQYVSRPRKSKSRRSKQAPAPPTVESLTTTLEDTQPSFRATSLCTRCLDALDEALKMVECLERIVCLGLGSLENDPHRISIVQLALLMELQTKLKTTVVVYDPVFTDLDTEFLKSLGFDVKTLMDEDYDATQRRTLFYLPHCDRTTNEAVISQLMATDSLKNSILLGNDLRKYEHILPTAQLKILAPSIYKVTVDGLLEYRNLEPKHREENWDAFSDLCLMWPSHPLPDLSKLELNDTKDLS